MVGDLFWTLKIFNFIIRLFPHGDFYSGRLLHLFPGGIKIDHLGSVAVSFHHRSGFMPSQSLNFKVGYAGKPPQGDERMAQSMKCQITPFLLIHITIRYTFLFPTRPYAGYANGGQFLVHDVPEIFFTDRLTVSLKRLHNKRTRNWVQTPEDFQDSRNRRGDRNGPGIFTDSAAFAFRRLHSFAVYPVMPDADQAVLYVPLLQAPYFPHPHAA